MTDSRDRLRLYQQLREQAVALQENYPELFAYLSMRETRVRRAVAWIPHPEDVEAHAGFDLHAHIIRNLGDLPPGVADLAADCVGPVAETR